MRRRHDEAGVEIVHDDCMNTLRSMPDNSVDAIQTDPPYDLTTGKKGGTGAASIALDTPYGRSRISVGNGTGGFMGKAWDSTGIAFTVELWGECLRVLKPGGYVLAFGGTRTHHRMVSAIEDAGFEIRDSITWLYGSGFPKSLDVSKAIDKAAGAEREVTGKYVHPATGKPHGDFRTDNDRAAYNDFSMCDDTRVLTAPATDDAKTWTGWGTALKPAGEVIVVARKPLSEKTVAANVLRWGTGAINVDGCRVESGADYHDLKVTQGGKDGGGFDVGSSDGTRHMQFSPSSGRWPANVVLSHAQNEDGTDACEDGCVDGCAVAELDGQSGITRSSTANGVKRHGRSAGIMGNVGALRDGRPEGHTDSGGASRFFPTFRYCAKAPTRERPKVDGVAHPTCKPLSLVRWLCRLVTPPGGIVLDPFAGSGTTVEAAILEGFRCIAIEAEATYLPLIDVRIARATAQGGRAT